MAQEQPFQDQISYELALKLRDLEEGQKLMKERVLLIGKNLIDLQEKNFSDFIELKKSVQELQTEVKRIKSVIESLSDEVSKSARKEELVILERQWEIFQPLKYLRVEDVDKIIEKKLSKTEQKTKPEEHKNNFKQSGYKEGDIVKMLQEEGISPREINDGIAQSRIKEAVSTESVNDIEQQDQLEPSLMNTDMQQAQSSSYPEQYNQFQQPNYQQQDQSYQQQYPQQQNIPAEYS